MNIPLHHEMTDSLCVEQVDQLLAHMLRIPELFALARSHVAQSLFDQGGEAGRWLVWRAALQAAEQYTPTTLFGSAAAARAAVEAEVKIVASHGGVIPEVVEEVCQVAPPGTENDPFATMQPGLLQRIYELPEAELNLSYGKGLLQKFLRERVVPRPLKDRVNQAKGKLIANLPALLEGLAQKDTLYQNLDADTTLSMEDEWDSLQAELEIHRGKLLVGLRTGLSNLDEMLCGARGLMVLGAGPGVGKTTLAIELGLGVCQHWDANNAVFVFVSLEMPRKAMYTRVLCNRTRMDWKTVVLGSRSRRGQTGVPAFTPEDQQRLDAASQALRASGLSRRILILDRQALGASLSVAGLLAQINAFKAQLGAARALIAIDYLQLLPVPDQVARQGDLEADRHRVQFLQDLLAGTRSAANPEGDAVLVISEARKPSGGRARNWAANPADLMGSARVAYAADAILLYRPLEQEEVGEHTWPVPWDHQPSLHSLQQDGIAPVRLAVAKGRDGMRRGSWAMAFHFEESRFTEVGGEPSGEHVPVMPVHQVQVGGVPNDGAHGDGLGNQDDDNIFYP